MTGTDGDCLPYTTTDWFLLYRKWIDSRDCFQIYSQIKKYMYQEVMANFIKGFTKIHDNEISLFSSF